MNAANFESWSEEKKRQFAEQFACAYNLAHGSEFAVPKILSEDQDYDFILKGASKDAVLRVQHTLAGADAELEYIRPKNAQAVIDTIRKRLRHVARLAVHLNIARPPSKKEEVEKLAQAVAFLVEEQARCMRRPALFRYAGEDDALLNTIRPYVDDLEIFSSPQLEEVCFGWSSSRVDDGGILGDDQRIDMAIGKKEEKYAKPGDVVLIVHCNVLPIVDYYIGKVREEQGARKFMGIWLYDEQRQFIRVK